MAPVDCEAVQVSLHVIARHHVEDDIRPLAIGKLVDLLDEVVGLVIDREIRADAACSLALFVAPGRGHDLEAELLGELDCHCADPASPAMH